MTTEKGSAPSAHKASARERELEWVVRRAIPFLHDSLELVEDEDDKEAGVEMIAHANHALGMASEPKAAGAEGEKASESAHGTLALHDEIERLRGWLRDVLNEVWEAQSQSEGVIVVPACPECGGDMDDSRTEEVDGEPPGHTKDCALIAALASDKPTRHPETEK